MSLSSTTVTPVRSADDNRALIESEKQSSISKQLKLLDEKWEAVDLTYDSFVFHRPDNWMFGARIAARLRSHSSQPLLLFQHFLPDSFLASLVPTTGGPVPTQLQGGDALLWIKRYLAIIFWSDLHFSKETLRDRSISITNKSSSSNNGSKPIYRNVRAIWSAAMDAFRQYGGLARPKQQFINFPQKLFEWCHGNLLIRPSTFNELSELWAKLFNLGQSVCLDETMEFFLGKSDDVQHVPSKPHPVGLWITELCAALENTGSKVLIGLRALTADTPTATTELVKEAFVDHLDSGHKPTVVFDRYYCNQKVMTLLEEHKIPFMGSGSVESLGTLGQELKKKVKRKGEWCGVYCEDRNMLVVLFNPLAERLGTKCLVTNALTHRSSRRVLDVQPEEEEPAPSATSTSSSTTSAPVPAVAVNTPETWLIPRSNRRISTAEPTIYPERQPSACNLCGESFDDTKECSVCCDECHRWCHFSCTGITYAPRADSQFRCNGCWWAEWNRKRLKREADKRKRDEKREADDEAKRLRREEAEAKKALKEERDKNNRSTALALVTHGTRNHFPNTLPPGVVEYDQFYRGCDNFNRHLSFFREAVRHTGSHGAGGANGRFTEFVVSSVLLNIYSVVTEADSSLKKGDTIPSPVDRLGNFPCELYWNQCSSVNKK